MSIDKPFVFAFNEKLPWKHEIISMILEQARSGTPSGKEQTGKRKKAVSAMTYSVIAIWKKAFGEEPIYLSYKSVKDKIIDMLKEYHNTKHCQL